MHLTVKIPAVIFCRVWVSKDASNNSILKKVVGALSNARRITECVIHDVVIRLANQRRSLLTCDMTVLRQD